jgi:tocopherol O-methyltransferase
MLDAPGRRPLSLGRVRDFYESRVVIQTFNHGFAGKWHTRVVPDAPGPKDSLGYVAQWLGLAPRHHVLDFGCGVGVVATEIARTRGCRVRGLNISRSQIALAVQRSLSEPEMPVHFDWYDGQRFQYETATFERATFFESPCHVPDKENMARELFRVLGPVGACGGQDWALTDAVCSEADYRDYIEPIEAACEVSLWSLNQYRQLFERAGFRRVEVIDARHVYAELATSFTRPTDAPVRVSPDDDFAERLRKGNQALSNAFHRGLFTIALLRADKGEAAPPDIYSSGKNRDCIRYHQRTFGVESSGPLDALLGLTAETADATVESSCKWEGDSLHSARWNLFYHGADRTGFWATVKDFIAQAARAAGASVDYALLDAFVGPGLNFSGVRKIVTGIDLRAQRATSRLKVWFMLADETAATERAIALGGDDPAVRQLWIHPEFLVGFDLRLDGRTAIKLYPDVRPWEIEAPAARARLRASLSDRALRAMQKARWTHVYLAAHNQGTILQLHPSDPDGFMREHLDRERSVFIHRHYQATPMLDMVVSVRESELGLPGGIRDFSLYYMPAESPSPGDT